MIFEPFMVPPSWWQPLAYSTENDNNSKNKAIMKEIDWEQRRYEIAKDVFCGCVLKYDNGSKITAQYAVEYADALIEVLKETSE